MTEQATADLGAVYVFSVSTLPDYVKVGKTMYVATDEAVRRRVYHYLKTHRIRGEPTIHDWFPCVGVSSKHVDDAFKERHDGDCIKKGKAREFFLLTPERAIASLRELINNPNDIPFHIRSRPHNRAADEHTKRQQHRASLFKRAKKRSKTKRLIIKTRWGEVVFCKEGGVLKHVWDDGGAYYFMLNPFTCQLVIAACGGLSGERDFMDSPIPLPPYN